MSCRCLIMARCCAGVSKVLGASPGFGSTRCGGPRSAAGGVEPPPPAAAGARAAAASRLCRMISTGRQAGSGLGDTPADGGAAPAGVCASAAAAAAPPSSSRARRLDGLLAHSLRVWSGTAGVVSHEVVVSGHAVPSATPRALTPGTWAPRRRGTCLAAGRRHPLPAPAAAPQGRMRAPCDMCSVWACVAGVKTGCGGTAADRHFGGKADCVEVGPSTSLSCS